METIREDLKDHAVGIGNNPDTGITIDKVAGKTNIILDMSKFDLFHTCHFRYYMRYVLEKQAKEKNPALDRGGLLHEGLDVYYSLLRSGMHFNDRMQHALLKIREVSCNTELCQLDDEDVELVYRTIQENLDFWRFEDEQLEILLVEEAFAHVIYEDDYIRIIVSGKIDLLVNKPGIGGASGYNNLPIDHKTMSRNFETLRLANQFQCYADAVGSNFLIVNKIGFQKSLKAEDKFLRVPLSYDHLILAEWKRNTIAVILDEYLQCIASSHWKQNFTSCTKYNRICEYYPICDTSGQEAKLYKMNSEYGLASPWDVTKNLTWNKGK